MVFIFMTIRWIGGDGQEHDISAEIMCKLEKDDGFMPNCTGLDK